MQLALVGLTPRQQVACAICCCNKRPYDYTKGRDSRKACQTVGNRKHSCVLRNLRQAGKDGKPTKKNRDENVKASPPGQKIPKTGPNAKMRIPDTLINENGTWKIIDAKFPCATDEINAKMGTQKKRSKKIPEVINGGKGITYEGDSTRAAAEMMGKKEENYYPRYKVDGNEVGEGNVEPMTPKEAEAQKGNCTCEEWTSDKGIQARTDGK